MTVISASMVADPRSPRCRIAPRRPVAASDYRWAAPNRGVRVDQAGAGDVRGATARRRRRLSGAIGRRRRRGGVPQDPPGPVSGRRPAPGSPTTSAPPPRPRAGSPSTCRPARRTPPPGQGREHVGARRDHVRLGRARPAAGPRLEKSATRRLRVHRADGQHVRVRGGRVVDRAAARAGVAGRGHHEDAGGGAARRWPAAARPGRSPRSAGSPTSW